MHEHGVKPWLIIDASHQGELRIAHVTPGKTPAIAPVRQYQAAELLTFTDGLLRYERETGLGLRNMPSVLAIAGAATGDSIPIARSRWTISRSGIAATLGQPPIIVNEVAAQAWATLGQLPIIKPLRGRGMPDLAKPGRYAFLTVTDGVGAALIDVDDRHVARIAESEAGHIDFAPRTEDEATLARTCDPMGGGASWEQMLLLDPETIAGRLGPARAGKVEVARIRSALLGRFTANLILAFGAWRGALLTGPRVAQIATQLQSDSFDAAFGDRRNFRRLLAEIPCWRIEQHQAVIMGSLALIAQHTATH